MKHLVLKLFLLLILLCTDRSVGYAAGYDSVLWERARHLRDLTDYDSAYVLYDSLYSYRDSLYTASYEQKIGPLRERYKLDELALENKRKSNLIYLEIAFLLVTLVLAGLLSWLFLRWNNRKLVRSKEDMEAAKRLAEISICNKSLSLSNMSHEIRTPLNALVGFSDVLAMDGIDSESRKQCNEVIQLNSELLLKLINDVVDISSIDVRNMKFNIYPYDVVGLCRNVVSTVEKIKRTDAVLVFETDLDSLVLMTDINRLQQVLINILVNATKFTKQGNIVLKLERKDAVALFSITDTGCGIPLEKREKIFNRFEKLNEKAQGFGLGLSICELILKRLGGAIWIDPEYNNGTRFLFTHPLSQDQSL